MKGLEPPVTEGGKADQDDMEERAAAAEEELRLGPCGRGAETAAEAVPRSFKPHGHRNTAAPGGGCR